MEGDETNFWRFLFFNKNLNVLDVTIVLLMLKKSFGQWHVNNIPVLQQHKIKPIW